MGEASCMHGRNEKFLIKFWLENLKGSLGGPRRRCEGNFRMGLRKVDWENVD
jgi:hypothetical protein